MTGRVSQRPRYCGAATTCDSMVMPSPGARLHHTRAAQYSPSATSISQHSFRRWRDQSVRVELYRMNVSALPKYSGEALWGSVR